MDDTAGKLKRMLNIKGGCNRYKTKKERIKILTHLRDALEAFLDKGLSPYLDPDLSMPELENSIKTEQHKTSITTPIPNIKEIQVVPEPIKVEPKEAVLSIKEAFDHAYKKNVNIY